MLEDVNAKKRAPATEPSTRVVRVRAALLERAERVGEAMAKRIGGTALPETYVVSACLERGLDALEAELGVKGKR
jgi:hypothetical protein